MNDWLRHAVRRGLDFNGGTLVEQIGGFPEGYTSPAISLMRTPSDYDGAVGGEDRSLENRASMLLFLEIKGCRILLPGDANWEQILAGMSALEARQFNDELVLDAMALPHHGSDRNVSPEFFKRVRAKHYLVFGNGRHGNPERASFEMLLGANPAPELSIHFANSINQIEERASRKRRSNDWQENTHGLNQLFASMMETRTGLTIRERGEEVALEIDVGS